MKLTQKDKHFIQQLKALLNEKELHIDLKEDGLKMLILKKCLTEYLRNPKMTLFPFMYFD